MVLIHGAWLSARSWENFADYFTRKGYDVEIPEWPRKHGDVEELRRNASELAGLGVAEIVDHYDRLVRGRKTQPVLIGRVRDPLPTATRNASEARGRRRDRAESPPDLIPQPDQVAFEPFDRNQPEMA